MLLRLLLIVVISANIFASGFEQLFNEGNELYRNGKYNEAIVVYKKMLDSNFESANLFYNLGNCYYRLDKLGYAILFYEKGKKLSPGDDDISHNLLFARNNTIDKIETLPSIFIFEWWESLIAVFSVDGWTYLLLLFLFFLLISISVFLLTRNPIFNRYSFFSGLISFLLLIFTLAVLLVRLNTDASQQYGVVIESVVEVKTSPDKSSKNAFIIHEGLKSRIDDKLDNWYKIKLEDGKVGWIEESKIGLI
jgi:tetratricopeptide (TPR) repeat protein